MSGGTIHLSTPQREENVIKQVTGLPENNKQRAALKFVYVHYPQSWHFNAEHGFLPSLKKMIAKPGVNGVGPKGELTSMLASVRSKGGTFIDPKDHRLGEYKDYVHYYPTQAGGKWYVDFCQKATVLPTGQIVWNTRDTLEPMAEFAAHIRDSGIIEPLMYEFYLGMVEAQKVKVSRLQGRADRNPSVTTKAKQAEAKLDAMQASWEKNNKRLTAKTKAKAKTAKAKAPVLERCVDGE